jgi:hypothetical protein
MEVSRQVGRLGPEGQYVGTGGQPGWRDGDGGKVLGDARRAAGRSAEAKAEAAELSGKRRPGAERKAEAAEHFLFRWFFLRVGTRRYIGRDVMWVERVGTVD